MKNEHFLKILSIDVLQIDTVDNQISFVHAWQCIMLLTGFNKSYVIDGSH